MVQGAPRSFGLDLCLSILVRYKVGLDTWNLGMLIGRNREFSKVSRRRNVNICYMHDQNVRKRKQREIDKGYTIIYLEQTSIRNGVGKLKGKVLTTDR